MRVISLKISKRESYDNEYPNEIVGIVQIGGDTGKMEVRLQPKTVSEIFRLCRNDVQKTAERNAAQAGLACDNAADNIELQLGNQELKQIGGVIL